MSQLERMDGNETKVRDFWKNEVISISDNRGKGPFSLRVGGTLRAMSSTLESMWSAAARAVDTMTKDAA